MAAALSPAPMTIPCGSGTWRPEAACDVLEGHSDSVLSVAWSPDGRRALSGADDNTVRLWDVETGGCLRVLEGHSASV